VLKFFRIKGTELRKVALVDEEGNRTKVALIGLVEELIEKEVLEPAFGMNERAWVCIPMQDVNNGKNNIGDNTVLLKLVEHDTLEEAKDFARELAQKMYS